MSTLLAAPLSALVPWIPESTLRSLDGLTIEQFLTERGIESQVRRLGIDVSYYREIIVEQLEWAARAITAGLESERQSAPVRARVPMEPSEQRLVQQLLALRATIRAEVMPVGGRHIRTTRDRCTVDPPVLFYTYQDSTKGRYPETYTIRLAIEALSEPGAASCSCPARSQGRCPHVLRTIDQLLEELAAPQRSEPLQTLLATLAVPAWRRTLAAVDAALKSQAPAPARLTWVIQPFQDRVMIDVFRNGYGKRGRALQPRRVTIDAVARSRVAGDHPADARALALIQGELELSPASRSPRRFQELSEVTAKRVVAALAGHPRVVTREVGGEETPLQIETATLALDAREGDDGAIQLDVVLGETRTPRPDLIGKLERGLVGDTIVEVDTKARTCRAIKVSQEARVILSALRGRRLQVPREARLEVLRRLPQLERTLPVHRDAALKGAQVTGTAQPFLRLAPATEDVGVRADLLVRPAPGLPAFPPGEGPAEALGFDAESDAPIWAVRELEAERAAAQALLAGLPELTAHPTDAPWTFQASGPDALDVIAALEERQDLPAEWAEGDWRPSVRRGRAEDLSVTVTDQRDWFGLRGGLDVDGQLVQLAALLEAVRKEQRYVRLSKGAWLAIGGELSEQLRRIDDLSLGGGGGSGSGESGESAAEVAVGVAAPLVLADLADGIGELRASAGWRSAIARLQSETNDQRDPPAGLEATLRPYQLDGYRWLSRLAGWGFGACLADDMGLGKTLQAIAILVERAADGPALVVAPTSVAFNWCRELARFAPGLRPVPLREVSPGERAAVLEGAGPGDVVITGYGLLVKDIEALATVRFSTFVLDEAQAVKNAETDRARAARRIDAGWRLALTGTPVENHLGELWSLLRIVSPGLLGSWEQFRRRFVLPIKRDSGSRRRRSLASLLRPFVLRRTKDQVARDLPEKAEIQVDVTLSKAERRRYEQARLAAIAEVTGMVETLPVEQRRFAVLAALTRLRQLACHPRLIDPRSKIPSSKVDAAVKILRDLRDEGHRALVFSQFTRLLDLVEKALDAEGISHLRLDGRTPAGERARVVDAFQGGDATVLLLSLKAGGTGLNLTAADYVLHLDPWWNPAAEDQATDRAHRIGQTRPVTVYRLVARGTVEEEILAVHAEKRALVAGVLEGTDSAGKVETEALIALIKRSALAGGEELGAGDEAGDEPDEEGDSLLPAPAEAPESDGPLEEARSDGAQETEEEIAADASGPACVARPPDAGSPEPSATAALTALVPEFAAFLEAERAAGLFNAGSVADAIEVIEATLGYARVKRVALGPELEGLVEAYEGMAARARIVPSRRRHDQVAVTLFRGFALESGYLS